VKIHTLDKTGDSVLDLDLSDSEAVQEAERVLHEHLVAGGAAIQTKPGEATVVRTIDPAAEEIVFIPQIQGG